MVFKFSIPISNHILTFLESIESILILIFYFFHIRWYTVTISWYTVTNFLPFNVKSINLI